MGVLLVLLGLGWLIGTILKEEVFAKPAPQNTDYRQAVIDRYSNNLSGKESDRRMSNGYYVKKDK